MANESKQTSRATPQPAKPVIRRSLLDIAPKKPLGDAPEEVSNIPIEFTEDRKSPSLSLGFVTDEVEFIFPWIALKATARMGEQYSIAIDEYEVTLLIKTERATAIGWETPAQDISQGIHSQSIKWLHHRPDSGLTVQVTKREEETEE